MKQKLLLCGAAVFAVLFLFSGIMLQRQLADQKQSTDAFDHIADMVVEETEPDAAEQPEETGETEAPPALTAYEKYAVVYEQNPDFVGWISIDGTNINYPVMQTPSDPDFYLKHAFDKSYSDYGVPYVQENCDLEQSDNVVIYGHHMKTAPCSPTCVSMRARISIRSIRPSTLTHWPTLASMKLLLHSRRWLILRGGSSIIISSMRRMKQSLTSLSQSANLLRAVWNGVPAL